MSKLCADDEKIQLCEIVCVSQDATAEDDIKLALLEPRGVVACECECECECVCIYMCRAPSCVSVT